MSATGKIRVLRWVRIARNVHQAFASNLYRIEEQDRIPYVKQVGGFRLMIYTPYKPLGFFPTLRAAMDAADRHFEGNATCWMCKGEGSIYRGVCPICSGNGVVRRGR